MKKRALMALPKLTATDEMKQIATSDLPRKEKTDYGYVREVCEYYTYLRCIKQDGILKVAFFFPEHLRLDGSTEGRALHHCAGSSDRYWDRIERRESFVVFLRKTADPFHAYYTLEVEPDGTVRQKRTEYDRQKKDIEQATEFLQKWQRVITARLTENDKALAAESRILREKEFIQLKKDRVIIHTGHLAGRLLADVLMADLMENTDSIQSPVLAAAA